MAAGASYLQFACILVLWLFSWCSGTLPPRKLCLIQAWLLSSADDRVLMVKSKM
jgi:hypothetical protein